ncbi:hypothetical protein T492DRAFT_854138, partial [Pavlovales sp. CCMP2436]
PDISAAGATAARAPLPPLKSHSGLAASIVASATAKSNGAVANAKSASDTESALRASSPLSSQIDALGIRAL